MGKTWFAILWNVQSTADILNDEGLFAKCKTVDEETSFVVAPNSKEPKS